MIDLEQSVKEIQELYQFLLTSSNVDEAEHFKLEHQREAGGSKRLLWTVTVGCRQFKGHETVEAAISTVRGFPTAEVQKRLAAMEAIKAQLPAVSVLQPELAPQAKRRISK